MALAAGHILQGRYRIVKPVGQGGFGAVYRAWDLALKQPVAIKENNAGDVESQRRFEHEAKLLAGLRHPSLPVVIDHFILPGQGQYLVMDFIEGQSLGDLLDERGGPLREAEVLPWIRQVAGALTYLHTSSPPIIHRDIKPDNIIIAPNGRAVLVDFGISKLFRPGQRTTMGAQAVTPGFSPPEQYGRGQTDARSDVYALAATLYALLTGGLPPEAPDLSSGADVLRPPRQVNPAISETTSGAVMAAMALMMDRRLPSAAAFAGWLSGQAPVAATTGMPVVVSPTVAVGSGSWGAPPATAGASRGAPYWMWVAGVLGVLALLIGALLVFGGDNAPLRAASATEESVAAAPPSAGESDVATATPVEPTLAPAVVVTAALPSPSLLPTLPPEPTKTPAPQPTPTPWPTPTPAALILAPTASSFDGRNPLTGEVASGATLQRRPIAVKVDNSPNARPQSGLSEADVVYEHVTEGGVTRFTAIYYDAAPRVGPVRSGRLIDGELLAMYDAALAHTNPGDELRHWFADSPYSGRLFGESSAGFGRESPGGVNSVFVQLSQLWGEVSGSGLGAPRFSAYNAFSEAPPPGGSPAGSASAGYSGETVEWVYDAAAGRYERYMDGAAHVDAGAGRPITAANVVTLWPAHSTSGVCAHENDSGACDARSHDIRLWGSGPAVVYRDGLRYDVTWRHQQGRNDQLTFIDGGGQPFPLQIGNTWVQVMP